MTKPAIAVVGAGKVGSALAVALKKSGYAITGVASRSIKTAEKLGKRLTVNYTDFPANITKEAKIIFITTPDREIAATVESIAKVGGFRQGQVITHTSGSLPASIMAIVRDCGASVAAFHPLQSFADEETAIDNLPGSFFALEGDQDGLAVLQQVLEDLKGKGFVINEPDKPLYHVAATVASNYLVTITYLASEMLGKLGLSRQQSVDALYPLIQGTLNNIKANGTVNALTGPVERGDVITIERHVDALIQMQPDEQQAYKSLGYITANIAEEKGTIDKEVAMKIKGMLGGK